MIHDEGGKVFLTANSTIYQTPLQEPALTLSKGYKLFDVHIKGGSKMLSTTVKLACETAKKYNKPEPVILGVTLLSSFGQKL